MPYSPSCTLKFFGSWLKVFQLGNCTGVETQWYRGLVDACLSMVPRCPRRSRRKFSIRTVQTQWYRGVALEVIEIFRTCNFFLHQKFSSRAMEAHWYPCPSTSPQWYRGLIVEVVENFSCRTMDCIVVDGVIESFPRWHNSRNWSTARGRAK